MIGEIMKNKLSIAALVAGGMMVATAGSAQAADLGGDCCADLEERVATLEATTARKGNRKVSLTISGQVNKQLMIWDDGNNSDAYVVDNTASSSRFRFKGEATINSDWSAGYYIEIETRTSASASVSQANDDLPGGTGLNLRQSNMFIKSKTYGSLRIGQGSPSTDDLVFSGNVVGTSVANSAGDPLATGGGLFVNQGVNTLRIADFTRGQAMADHTTRLNVIRYDSPTIAGFVLSATWGEDDFWDVSIRTTQKLGDFTLKAAAGYNEFGGTDGIAIGKGISDEQLFHVTAGLIHEPTGLFVQGWYTDVSYDQFAGATAVLDGDAWNIQAGIKQRWNSLGHTAVYGGYTVADDMNARSSGIAAGSSTEYKAWEVGVIQYVDAAALELYAQYRNMETELNGVDQNDIDVVTVGGRIKF